MTDKAEHVILAVCSTKRLLFVFQVFCSQMFKTIISRPQSLLCDLGNVITRGVCNDKAKSIAKMGIIHSTINDNDRLDR